MAPKETDRPNEKLEDERDRLSDKERKLTEEQQKEILKGKNEMPDDPVSPRDRGEDPI
ncbi:hypothetical protein RCC94_14170 [Exiguobacterium acetylicum]|uniref:hypothetical protein n=1 Tax=Exiguobacterium TaxID=33986 RepID=UPI00044658FA|nr:MULTISPECIES: hypothetical protein [Exiguobacterium]EZP58572.1 hypothetical protein BW42_02877 [Exiguobacterium sp. RIT341]MDQ6468639.1 hypothetical protein [Exiguobacterium acetylicum]